MLNDNILDNLTNGFGDEQPEYERATSGQRFANYIIDRIALVAIITVLAGVVDSIVGDSALGQAFPDGGLSFIWFYDYFISAILATIVFTLLEFYLKGKTLGKYVTRTRAVQLNDRRLSFKAALLRSLVRQVPFEPFSFLGGDPPTRGWHDAWADTKVIKDRDWTDRDGMYV